MNVPCRQIADGADISLVSRIFRGNAPSLYTAYKLAGSFRITIDQVLAAISTQVSPRRLRTLSGVLSTSVRPDSACRRIMVIQGNSAASSR